MEEELLKEVMRLLDEGKADEAIKLIDENRKNITSKYHEFNIVYIKALMGVGKFDDALDKVEEELSMPYIPSEFISAYEELHQSLTVLNQEEAPSDFSDAEIRDILNSRPMKEEFFFMVLKLGDKNIRNYLEEIRNLLKDKEVPNLHKLLILSALQSQEVNLDLEFTSSYGSKIINSSDNLNNFGEKSVDKCFLLLDNCSKDFNLIEVSKKNLMGILVAMLPLEAGEDDVVDLAATAYYKACHMLGNNISKTVLLNKFKNVNLDKVDYFESVEVE